MYAKEIFLQFILDGRLRSTLLRKFSCASRHPPFLIMIYDTIFFNHSAPPLQHTFSPLCSPCPLHKKPMVSRGAAAFASFLPIGLLTHHTNNLTFANRRIMLPITLFPTLYNHTTGPPPNWSFSRSQPLT